MQLKTLANFQIVPIRWLKRSTAQLVFRTLLSIVLLLVSALANACVNEYGTTLDGKVRRGALASVPELISIDKEFYRDRVATLSKTLDDAKDYENISDLAVAHMYLGEIDRAITLLENAEQIQPGEYIVAANLGTAYELAGRNEDALEWIQKGIQRNSKAHDESEWVHVNLLRAKIEMAKEPNWLSSHSISGLSFGDADLPRFLAEESADNCPHDLHQLSWHLRYQLEERRKFVPGPDPIVAALMFDLANATAITNTAEGALPIYRTALELGFHDQELINRRILTLETLRKNNVLSGMNLEGLICIGFYVIFAIAFIFMVIRWWRRRFRTTRLDV